MKNSKTTLFFIKWALRSNFTNMIIFGAIIFLALLFSGFFSFYIPVALMGYAIYLSVKLCGYLHNRRKCDVYNSLPLSNISLFLNTYISGLIITLIPIILVMPLESFIFQMYSLPQLLYCILFYSLTSILLYTFCMLIGILSYKTRDMVITIIAVSIAFPSLYAFYNSIIAFIIPGYVSNQSAISITDSYINNIFTFISPLSPTMNNSSELYYVLASNEYSLNSQMVLYVIATIVLLGVALFISTKRKAELVEDTYSLNAIPIIITSVISITVSNILYFMLTITFNIRPIVEENNINPYLVFIISGLIIAIFAILAYLICMYIFFKSNMSKKKHLVSCGIVIALVISTFTIVSTGMFGTDTRTPKVEDVNKVYIQLSFGIYDVDLTEYNEEDNYSNYPTYTSEEDIEQVIETNKMVAEFIKDYTIYPYMVNNNYPLDITDTIKYSPTYINDEDSRTFYIRYDIKDSETDIVKRYYINDIVNSNAPEEEKKKVLQAIQDLANTREFKEKYTGSLLTNTEYFYWTSLIDKEYTYEDIGELTNIELDEESSNYESLKLEFNNALKEDVLADEEFFFNEYNDKNNKEKKYVYIFEEQYIYIPSTYTNTLKVWEKIEEEGIITERLSYSNEEYLYYTNFSYIQMENVENVMIGDEVVY